MKKFLPKYVNSAGTFGDFGERVFLTPSEWHTYVKNRPVRYCHIKRKSHCEVCGEAITKDRPGERAHKIPFAYGVTQLGLTPDFVNRPDNFLTAHRGACNHAAELDLWGIFDRLAAAGVKHLPDYLPEQMHDHWEEWRSSNSAAVYSA